MAVTFYQAPAQRSLQLLEMIATQQRFPECSASILLMTREEIFILTASFREQESNKVEKAWWKTAAYIVAVKKQREREACIMGFLLLYLLARLHILGW